MTTTVSLAVSLALAAAPAVEPSSATSATAPAETTGESADPAAADAAEAPAAAEGPEPAPATEAPSGQRSGGSAPPEPRWRGTGLAISAGVFGALGLGANIGRIAAGSRLCRELGYDQAQGVVVGGDECLAGSTTLAILGPVALTSNLLAFGFSAGAGAQHGRWAAHRTAFAGEREQSSGVQIGVGAGLMAAGIITYFAVRIASYVDLLGADTCQERYPIEDTETAQMNVDPFKRCMGRRLGGYLAGITVGQAMGVVGVGLLSHGATYRRNLKLMRYIEAGQLRLRPTFGLYHAGLALGGRF